MAKYRVNFFDKNGDEFRSITVEAANEEVAEDVACKRIDDENWPKSFRLGDVEELEA